MSTALVKSEPKPIQPSEFSVFGSVTHFEIAQRMAKALCTSPMVPDTYRGEGNIGSCLIALELANRIGMNVLAVTQNLYIVHGKPAWSSQFLIACINASGKFSPLRYKMTGDPKSDSFGCIAWATDKTGEKLESPEITIGTAKAEGWFQKNGSKWKTMPELMLRYRTATLFARLYAPELTMGIRTDDEVIDIVEVAPVVTEGAPDFSPQKVQTPAEQPEPAAPATPPEPKRRGRPAAHNTAQPTKPAEAAPVQNPELPARNFQELENAMVAADVTTAQVLAFYNDEVRKPEIAVAEKMEDIPEKTAIAIAKNLAANEDFAAKIRGIPPV